MNFPIMLRSTHERHVAGSVNEREALYQLVGYLRSENRDLSERSVIIAARMVAAESRADELGPQLIARALDVQQLTQKNAALAADLETQRALNEKLLASSQVAVEVEKPQAMADLEQRIAEAESALQLTRDTPAIVTKDREKRRREIHRLTEEITSMRGELQAMGTVREPVLAE